jgi:hypothetical protein
MSASADSLPDLQDSEAWRSSLLLYNPKLREYGLAVHMASEPLYEPIRFCPWCSADLGDRDEATKDV